MQSYTFNLYVSMCEHTFSECECRICSFGTNDGDHPVGDGAAKPVNIQHPMC